MRQIGTLPDGDAAQTLADYLLTLKIKTSLEQQPEGWLIWVCDEDHVDQARREFADFARNPQDTRFAGVSRAANELRLREFEQEEDYVQRQTDFREKMAAKPVQARNVTFLVIAVAVGVTLLTNFGDLKNPFTPRLFITSEPMNPQLTQIAHGELWRLVTPIFVHMNVLHLLFNCGALASFAGQVKRFQGSTRLLWLLLVFAILSNIAQFYLGDPRWVAGFGLVLVPSPYFGGLSGVVYGFFGYVWMKSRFAPELGMQMSRRNVALLVIWFLACLTGVLGDIANMAHAAGLILGLIFGAGPYWRQLLGES